MDSFNQPPQNPYATPTKNPGSGGSGPGGQGGKAKIIAPGVGVIIVGTLGLLFSLYNVVIALSGGLEVDPNVPEWLQDIQRQSGGATAAIVQSLFVIVNAVIIVGGVSMVRCKYWGVALTGSILAMVNFGSCCCLLGLPVGIWSVVILSLEDVRRMMKR